MVHLVSLAPVKLSYAIAAFPLEGLIRGHLRREVVEMALLKASKTGNGWIGPCLFEGLHLPFVQLRLLVTGLLFFLLRHEA